jgi:hypothetical protein
MKLKTTLLVMATITALSVPATASAQGVDNAVLNRLASWLSPPIDDAWCGSCGARGYDPCYAEDFYCNDGRCGDCAGCSHTNDIWGSVEFLLWWAKGTPLPPLATTSLSGTPVTEAGVLGFDSTRILYGDELAGQKVQAGGRVELGLWLDPEHNMSASGRFFGLGGDRTTFNASSTGDPILARPFFNVLLDAQDALLIAYPGLVAGAISTRLDNQNVLGAEALFELMMVRDCDRRVDAIVGYQFLRLDDALQINSTHQIIEPGPTQGITFDVTDRFAAKNQFHGGVLGLKGRVNRGCWSVDGLAKVGIGNLRETVIISGQTVTSVPAGGSVTSVGGLLTQESNIGTFERDKFIFVPEFTVNLRYYVNRCVSFHVGYNLIWLSDVALSGQQIDLGVNTQQPGGPQRPAFNFVDDDYWLQGINFGMNWDF